MATTKPRHSITFEPADYDVLRRMAALEGSSISRIVSDLVSSVTPALSRAVDVMEAAANARGEVQQNLRRVADESEPAMLEAMGTALAEFEALMGEMQRAANGEDPRPVITGVRSGNPHNPTTSEKGL